MPNIIVPAPGMAFRCRNGHLNSWDVRIVAASGSGKAVVVSVRCAVCSHTIKLGNDRILEGSGKRTDKKTGLPLTIPPGSEPDGRAECG